MVFRDIKKYIGLIYKMSFRSATNFANFPASNEEGFLFSDGAGTLSFAANVAAVSALDITGGQANQVLYQNAPDSTTFTNTPTPGHVLKGNSLGVPSFDFLTESFTTQVYNGFPNGVSVVVILAQDVPLQANVISLLVQCGDAQATPFAIIANWDDAANVIRVFNPSGSTTGGISFKITWLK